MFIWLAVTVWVCLTAVSFPQVFSIEISYFSLKPVVVLVVVFLNSLHSYFQVNHLALELGFLFFCCVFCPECSFGLPFRNVLHSSGILINRFLPSPSINLLAPFGLFLLRSRLEEKTWWCACRSSKSLGSVVLLGPLLALGYCCNSLTF